MTERLQKFLAKAGLGSRRHCENLIKEKKVFVNGKIAKIGSKVSPNDEVICNSIAIKIPNEDLKVLMLNKPVGVLSSSVREKKKEK